MTEKIIAVLIRSGIRHGGDVRDTLKILGLKRKNNAVILEKKAEIMGMVNKVKDLITWGEVNEEILKELEKRKSKVYSLHPPRKGFGRKGIKVPFKVGGGLGYRGDKINDLIKRML